MKIRFLVYTVHGFPGTKRRYVIIVGLDGCDQVVATAQLDDWQTEHSLLCAVHVHRHHRRKGIGRMLCLFAIDYCRQHRKRNVWLYVRESNARAKALYASLGFRPILKNGDDRQMSLDLVSCRPRSRGPLER